MDQLDLFNSKFPRPRKRPKPPQEFKVIALRDCPMPEHQKHCESAKDAVAYWNTHVATSPQFNPACECCVVLLLNTRRRILGHHLVTIGILDAVLLHAREAFRAAIVSASHAVLLIHNHPSGDPLPSEADIRLTRELIRASDLVKIQILDHVIVGHGKFTSLRELGIFPW